MSTKFYLSPGVDSPLAELFPFVETYVKLTGIHVGIRGGGWAFLLRLYPAIGLGTLQDWKREFNTPYASIVDGAGVRIPASQMIEFIEKGSRLVTDPSRPLFRTQARTHTYEEILNHPDGYDTITSLAKYYNFG